MWPRTAPHGLTSTSQTEYGAIRGTSTFDATDPIIDALDLRHRFPRLWRSRRRRGPRRKRPCCSTRSASGRRPPRPAEDHGCRPQAEGVHRRGHGDPTEAATPQRLRRRRRASAAVAAGEARSARLARGSRRATQIRDLTTPDAQTVLAGADLDQPHRHVVVRLYESVSGARMAVQVDISQLPDPLLRRGGPAMSVGLGSPEVTEQLSDGDERAARV